MEGKVKVWSGINQLLLFIFDAVFMRRSSDVSVGVGRYFYCRRDFLSLGQVHTKNDQIKQRKEGSDGPPVDAIFLGRVSGPRDGNHATD